MEKVVHELPKVDGGWMRWKEGTAACFLSVYRMNCSLSADLLEAVAPQARP